MDNVGDVMTTDARSELDDGELAPSEAPADRVAPRARPSAPPVGKQLVDRLGRGESLEACAAQTTIVEKQRGGDLASVLVGMPVNLLGAVKRMVVGDVDDTEDVEDEDLGVRVLRALREAKQV